MTIISPQRLIEVNKIVTTAFAGNSKKAVYSEIHCTPTLCLVYFTIMERRTHIVYSHCGKSAFTLVEIMVVVAIIALLTAIAVPAFLQYQSDAQLSLCLDNLRMFQNALSVYNIKTGAYPITANDLAGYFTTFPVCPAGAEYKWSLAADTYHVVCDAQHSSESSHTCIHENQAPLSK